MPIDITHKIAKELQWNDISFKLSNTAILSPYEIKFVAEGNHFGIAKINDVYFCSIHLTDYPYIAFEASGIPYALDGEKPFTSKNAKVLESRSSEVRRPILNDLKIILDTLPIKSKIIIGGDFNEPSHLDWIHGQDNIPFCIKFPSTKLITEFGFIDTFRYIYPNPIKHKGYTWPDRIPEYKHRHDRIDYIFSMNITPTSSIVISTILSDHSIVKTTF